MPPHHNGRVRDEHRMVRRVGFALAWVMAATLAITIGIVAVTQVGASIRGRGPLGESEMIRNAELREGRASPDPDAERIRDVVEDEFGEFVVECRGAVAYGVAARPDSAAGWRTVSYEPGPDDDVDAVFANKARSIDIEAFCNRGRPTVSEIERNTLPDD